MTPYPPGTSAGDPRAPWNQPEAEECIECGGRYSEDGHERVNWPEQAQCYDCGYYWEDADEDTERCPECGSDDIGGIPCENDGMTQRELEQARKEMHMEDKMDERRLERAMGER